MKDINFDDLDYEPINENIFDGLILTFFGTLPKDYQNISEIVKSGGGKFYEECTDKCTYLVTTHKKPDINKGKFKLAVEKYIPIISFEFIKKTRKENRRLKLKEVKEFFIYPKPIKSINDVSMVEIEPDYFSAAKNIPGLVVNLTSKEIEEYINAYDKMNEEN